MGQVTYHPEARAEFKEAVAWYDRERVGLGERFDKAITAAEHDLLSYPSIWAKIRGPWRRALVKDFPYGLIYREDAEGLFVVAVMHLKRQPSYWYKRTR